MKIAFYSTSFFPYISGVSSMLFNLSLSLAEKGWQIALCVPKARSPVFKELRQAGVKIIFLPSFKTKLYDGKKFNVGAPSAKSFLQIKKFNPDIIHFHTPAFAGWEAILTAKILKKPLVGTFHTYFMSSEYQKIIRLGKISGDFIEKILWKYNNSVYNRCDLVVSPSQFAKRDLEKNGLKKPIKVIHNLINLDSFLTPPKEKILELKKKLKLNEKTVLYSGRISREKSLDILILAFNLVVRQMPSARLLLVGDGPAVDELKGLREALGLEENIIFSGKIEHQKLLDSGIFALSDLFAVASTSEVQPMSVLEAMAFGLPIIGVKARGMPELIKGNGFICQPGKIKDISRAIVKILRNRSLRKKFSQRSKELIKRDYCSKKIIGQWERTYKGLLT